MVGGVCGGGGRGLWGGVGGAVDSDEGDAYRDGGRLCPVLRGVMGNQVFHHCVFRHVLHEVRLLRKKTNNHRKAL